MGAIASILGSGKVVEKGIDLIDSLHTSDTERTEAQTKAKTDLLSAYAPFKIAQRYLALLFGFSYTLSFFVALTLSLWDDPSADTVTAVMTAFKLPYIMLMIVGFYFGGGAFEGGVEAVKRHKAKRAERETAETIDNSKGRR